MNITIDQLEAYREINRALKALLVRKPLEPTHNGAKVVLEDYQLKKLYEFVSEGETHYEAKDSDGSVVRIHKSQAMKLYWARNLNTYVSIPED